MQGVTGSSQAQSTLEYGLMRAELQEVRKQVQTAWSERDCRREGGGGVDVGSDLHLALLQENISERMKTSLEEGKRGM